MFRRSAHSQPSTNNLAQDLHPPPAAADDKVSSVSQHPVVTLASLSPQQRQELFRQGLLDIITKYTFYPLYDFFHARTGPKGCRVSGWIRFWYALVLVYSRTLLAVETDFLLDPINGVMPYRVTEADMQDYEWTIFQWAPESRLLVYVVVYSCVLAGWGLLLGIKPRFCAMVVFAMTHMLHNHNAILWDNQEHMVRLWAFFLIFMPLDHITVFDGFGGWCPWISNLSCWKQNGIGSMSMQYYLITAVAKTGMIQKCPPRIQEWFSKLQTQNCPDDIERGPTTNNHHHPSHQSLVEPSTSWPMWPFRLFQIYVCYIYLAAGLGKLVTTSWQNGTALWWLWYDGGFGRFFPSWVSEYCFNRMAMVKLQTWIALVIEIGCIVTIWIPSLRWYTFLAVVALHIGIELALIMHVFEYLSVIGWISFFVYPNDTMQKHTEESDTAVTKDDTLAVQQSSDDKESSKNKISSKSDKGGLTNRILALHNRKVVLESILVGVLLYFFTIDAVPRGVIMKVLPRGVGRTVQTLFFPSKATRTMNLEWGEWAGIHTGPWTVYAGTPPHSDYSLTAVIQYNNGFAPSVWAEEETYEHNDLQSLYLRERYYWTSTFTYYLSKEYQGENQAIPFVASFVMYLARKYSDGKIQFKPQRHGAPHVIIDPTSPIKSISLMAHSAKGNRYPKNVGLWESVPRSWSFESTCNYVLSMDELDVEFDISEMYKYNSEASFDEESGCNDLDQNDEKLHLEYGSFEGRKPTSTIS
jgi:uncharacterized membrane protein YphA (DoxX/SURF4 family)